MSEREPIWLTRQALVRAHYQQLLEHGGLPGLRDDNGLESALVRPRNLYWYDGERDLCALAAAYAFGIERNHPFADGNKRIGYVALETFLLRNGLYLEIDDAEIVTVMLRLAAGDLGEPELVDWVKQHAVLV